MSQFLRPIADSQVSSNWNKSTATFYEGIDEASPNDADFIWANNGTNSGALFKFSPASAPQAGAFTVRYRRAKVNSGTLSGTGDTVQIRAEVWEGGYWPSGTNIATDSYQTCSGSWSTRTWTPDLSAVTDWSDVYIIFSIQLGGGSPTRGAALSWVEIEIPDPASQTFNETVNEALAVSDSLSVAVTINASFSESALLDEVITAGVPYFDTIGEVASLSGSFSGGVVWGGTIAETITMADAFSVRILEPNGWEKPAETVNAWREAGGGSGGWLEANPPQQGWTEI